MGSNGKQAGIQSETWGMEGHLEQRSEGGSYGNCPVAAPTSRSRSLLQRKVAASLLRAQGLWGDTFFSGFGFWKQPEVIWS